MKDTYSTLNSFQRSQDAKRPTEGLVKAVRGQLADVLVKGMATILRGVKVVGGQPEAGMQVSLSWEKGVPVASVVGGTPSINQIAGLITGPQGPQGIQGLQGPQGVSISNLDGGAPDTNYGGITAIDCGGVV